MKRTDEKTKIIDEKICVSTKSLLDILNISQPTLSVWEKNNCPKIARGWWSIKDVLAWRGLVGNSGVKTSDEVKEKSSREQKLHFEAKLKEAQYESTELKNAIARGDYILKEEVTTELKRVFIVLKKSMQGYSRKIATDLSAFADNTQCRRIEKHITETTNDCLEQISINGVYDPKRK